MSKSNNEERRDIVNKRLSEINDKIVNPNKKTISEAPSENIQKQINDTPKNSNKLKKYLLRIAIVVILFFVLKSINFGDLISSSFNKTSSNDETKIEVKVDIPANKSNEKVNLKYNFNFEGGKSIIVFGNYQTEALAIEAKEKFAQNFVEFSLTYFFLPNKSNSSEEIYQLYLGPIDGESKAKQWSKLIGEKNQVINF
ncbi:hypothetical protein N9O83_04625 [Flavobacteriales bacterium]|nr:hypothetical protein [Flavobacteriales bacterium]